MRDVVLTIIFVVLLPMIIRRPYIGALAWAWVSLMQPHKLAYGFAFNLPFAQVIAITTLAVLPFTQQRRPFPWNGITILLIVFVCWMSFTTQWALNPDWEAVKYAWTTVLKIQLMLLVTLVLIRGREHIQYLVWVMVLSVGYYGTKGGIFTVTTGGAYRVWGPDNSFIGGNNELALALVMLIPLMYFLVTVSKNKWVRWGLWASMLSCVFSILGSHSRGALVAILAMSAFFIIKSNRPFVLSFVVSAVLAVAILAMPAEWFARMHTIGDYQDEASAASRLSTWATIWNMALDRPLIGAGFRTGSDVLYQKYATGSWGRSFEPHSIYFQALGEHGFPGLFMFLGLGVLTWRKASKLAKLCATGPDSDWVPTLMRMIQVSIIGYATGGAFLGLLHYDFPYYLAGLVVMVEATIAETSRNPSGLAQPGVSRGVLASKQ